MERGNGWEFRLVGRWVSGWVDGWVSVITPHPPNQPNSHTSPISLMYMNVLTKQAYICTYLLTYPTSNLNSNSSPHFINIFGSTNQANIPTYLEPNHNLPIHLTPSHPPRTGPRSAVGNVSGYRCVSDCRSRDCEFDPGPVPYFRGD